MIIIEQRLCVEVFPNGCGGISILADRDGECEGIVAIHYSDAGRLARAILRCSREVKANMQNEKVG